MVLSTPGRFVAACIPPARLEQPALWFVFRGAQILVQRSEQGTALPLAPHPGELGLPIMRHQYLGVFGGTHCFEAEADESTSGPASFMHTPG